MNEYESTIEFLFNQLPVFQSLGPGAYKPGLHTAHMLDNAFGNGHRAYKTVHVAGTNGKGSTSHMLAAALMAQGYKVGLYTSPHLADFRERIRVNGEKIDKEYVVDFVKRYRDKRLECEPSFFELTTIMAFEYFATQKVDYAVIEVGLGGRLDTTNIITPELSIITNISLDHTSLLGNTEAEIAREKAGIMKSGVPVVIGEARGDVRAAFEEEARKAGAPIEFAEDTPAQAVECDLKGDYQCKNITTVLHALRHLPVSDDAIRLGLANVQKSTGLMGRWMHLGECPEVVCDTGHNLGAWQYLAPKLCEIAAEKTLRVVLGFANDKDVDSIFRLLPKNATYYFVQPDVKRARTSESLLELAKSFGLKGCDAGTVAAGVAQAKADSSPSDFIYIGGSNFVVAEIPGL